MFPDLPKGPVLVTAAAIATGLAPAHAAPVDPSALPETGWRSGSPPQCLDPEPTRRGDELQVVGLARGANSPKNQQRARIDALARLLEASAAQLPEWARPRIDTAALEAAIRANPGSMPAALASRDVRRGRGGRVLAACYKAPAAHFRPLIDPKFVYDARAHLAKIALKRWPVEIGIDDEGRAMIVAGSTDGVRIGDRVVAVEGSRTDYIEEIAAEVEAALAYEPDRLSIHVRRDGVEHAATLEATLPLALYAGSLGFDDRRDDRAPTCGPCCHGASRRECR